jgi:hypothetical protein
MSAVLMRIPALVRLVSGLLAAALLVGLVPVCALGATMPKFQSSGDYMRLCASGQTSADCAQVFVEANNWVRFNSDARLCLPDEKTSFGSREYAAAMNEEAANVIGWLKDNPKSAGLDYVQSVGQGLIALYACK